ncbi:TonB-dependent receptor [Catenovulum sediminis]|uniref:TonB-dependent receptor n=1 Tax=Catenovulum sediminis TaxID=1740262 RepID=A0ABV1RCR8_9ALTE
MFSASSQLQKRERMGVNASAQWKLNDSFTLTGEYFSSDLDIGTDVVSTQYWTDRPQESLVLTEAYKISPTGFLEQGTINSNFYQANTSVQTEEASSKNFAVTLDWDSGQNLVGQVKLTSAKSDNDWIGGASDVMASQGNKIKFSDGSEGPVNPNGVSSFVYTLDTPLGAEIPVIETSGALTDKSQYWYKSQWVESKDTSVTANAIKADFSYMFDEGFTKSVSFGGRIADKDVDHTEYRFLNQFGDYQYYFKDPQIVDPVAGYTLLPIVTYNDNPSRLIEYGNFFSTSSGKFPSSILVEDPSHMKDQVTWLNSLYPNSPLTKAVTPITSYAVDESTKALYVMADMEAEFGSYYLTSNIGLRYVSTDLTVVANEVPAVLADGSNNNNSFAGFNGTEKEWTPVANKSSYSDVLPSINATLALSDEFDIKFAAAKVMARPNLNNLGRGFNIAYTGNFENGGPDGRFQRFASGSAGNPSLSPDRSTSYDLSANWYFSPGSAIIAAMFYKDIESFSVQQSSQEAIPDSDGVVRDGGVVSRVVNGQGGSVLGLELGAQHSFENGFGIMANYTYSDSENKDFVDPTSGESLPIPGVSKDSYNIISYYETTQFNARLAYNWRSKRLSSLFSGYPRYTREYGQLDASFGYNVNEQLAMSVEGINLTGNDNSSYLDVGDGEYFYDWQTDETRYVFSISYKF